MENSSSRQNEEYNQAANSNENDITSVENRAKYSTNESQNKEHEISTEGDETDACNTKLSCNDDEASSMQEASLKAQNDVLERSDAETSSDLDGDSESTECNDDDVLDQYIVDQDDDKPAEISTTQEATAEICLVAGNDHKTASNSDELCSSGHQADQDSGNEMENLIGQSTYHIKWFLWKGVRTPIITQNENGPCPLLAVMNVLLLTGRVSMPPIQEFITTEQIMEYLGDRIIELAPKNLTNEALQNYECNMHDAMAFIPKLQTGIDVNVKFTGVKDFEYTPELIVFDLISIGLYHGWLVDPQNQETSMAVGPLSYNQLVEKIIASKQADVESEVVSQGLAAETFLQQTASQLTYHGLCELNSKINDEEICVFFRNNHFSTLYKHNKELFLLVTDQGFLTEERVIWETLSNIEGDGNFVDADFHNLPMTRTPVLSSSLEPIPPLTQEDQDYMIALSLQQENENYQELSDAELAMRLQEEENRRHQSQTQAPPPAVAAYQHQQPPPPQHFPGHKQQPPSQHYTHGPKQAPPPSQRPTAAPQSRTPSPPQATGSSTSTQRQSDKSSCTIL